MDTERWIKMDTDVEFEVSSLGRLRRVINGTNRGDGYRSFFVRSNGVSKCITGHRLVAQYFLNDGKPLGQWDIVDHLNGKRYDNRLCNLRITTQDINSENTIAVRAAIKADLLKEMGLTKGYYKDPF